MKMETEHEQPLSAISTQVTVSGFSDEERRAVLEAAEKENRSVANFMRTAALYYIRQKSERQD